MLNRLRTFYAVHELTIVAAFTMSTYVGILFLMLFLSPAEVGGR